MYIAVTMISTSNQGIALDIVSWIFFLIALIVCCMRFYADICILYKPRLDTYISIATLVSLEFPPLTL